MPRSNAAALAAVSRPQLAPDVEAAIIALGFLGRLQKENRRRATEETGTDAEGGTPSPAPDTSEENPRAH